MLDCLPARLGNFSNAATQQSPFVLLISSTPSSKDEQAADAPVRGCDYQNMWYHDYCRFA